MNISERGLSLLKQSEGFSASAYICPAGKRTIGYGHVLAIDEKYPDGIDEQQAEALLINDVSETERAVSSFVLVPLNQNQFDALVVLIYNIGTGAFEKSTLLKDLNSGDIQAAMAQWRRWIYGGGKILDGLVARRNAEIALFMLV